MPSVVKNGKGKFCSRTCSARSQSENLSGKNHPNYKQIEKICPICGKTFHTHECRVKVGRGTYCSHKCASEAKLRGEKRTCLVCGKEFYATRAEQKRRGGKYCSNACVGKGNRGGNNPNWNGGEVECVCLNCGKKFFVNPARLKDGRGKFCSKECFNEWYRGENHPKWKGGIAYLPYCSKFNRKFRQRIRDKFDNKCFICGKTEEENGKKLSIHHVDYDKTCLCNTSNSCQFVPLCASCHSKTNGNRDYWERFLMAKLRSRLDGYYI